jgi:hypothetical protein
MTLPARKDFAIANVAPRFTRNKHPVEHFPVPEYKPELTGYATASPENGHLARLAAAREHKLH